MASKKKSEDEKVKCEGCKSYFVDEGELCDNCSKKKRIQEMEDEYNID